MLFDLRSRGRRRTVQILYLGLAVLMGGGLILFGVGTGSGNGGLLNAFSGGSSNKQSSIVSQAAKNAQDAVNKDPNSASAWGTLLQARWSDANSGGFDQSTSLYTTAGRATLVQVGTAWQRYAALTKSPDPDIATVAAEAYAALGQYSLSSTVWQAVTQAEPSQLRGYECLALTAYAAKQDRIGELAEGKVLSQVSKAEQKSVKSEIEAAKTQPSAAASC